ncbi:MAG: hypothetical protein ACOCWG_01510 [bacterium]
MYEEISEKLKKSCENAIVALDKLNSTEYDELKSKLIFVIGSYEYDKNPVGLHEYAVESYKILQSVKGKQPRKVAKKVLDDLEKSIKQYEQNKS